MPAYDFKHPEREEYIELFFSMNDEKKYTDEDGTEWMRVFEVPNARPPNRSVDLNKPIYDAKGNKMRTIPITDEFVKSQGFDNAADYIEWNNSMVDQTKTPEANTEKMHEQARDSEIKERIKENQENLKKSNKIAQQNKERLSKTDKRALKVEASTDQYFNHSDHKTESQIIKAYDKEAARSSYQSIKVNDKEVASSSKKTKKPKQSKKTK